MNMAVIEIENISRRFGSITALDGLSFVVKKGEIFGFVGPNGAGKTTMIRILLGLCNPDKGTARVFDSDVAKHFSLVGPRLGVVLEDSGLYEDLTGMENLNYHGLMYLKATEARAKRIIEVLEIVGLQDRGNDRVKTYSKGMKQRLAMALALVNDPDVLLLDEPFDGIDTETHRHLSNLLTMLAHNEGKSILFTSHNLADVEKLATRVAIIHKGRLIACSSVETFQKMAVQNTLKIVFSRPVTTKQITSALEPIGLSDSFDHSDDYITVSLNGSVSKEAVIAQLVASNLPVCEAVSIKNSLEDAYFALLSNQDSD